MTLELSSLMDDQLDAADREQVLRALDDDASLCHQWALYHMVGDVMREEQIVLSPGFSSRLAEKLQDEPPLHAVPVVDVQRPAANNHMWRVAAAVVGVAVALGAAISLRQAPAPDSPAIASAKGKTAVPPEAVMPMKGNAQDYLLAHQAYSPSGGLQGLVPYARTVSLNSEAPAQK